MNKNNNRKCINNGIQEKKVSKEELENYLLLGWNIGRIPFSEEHCKKISITKQGKSPVNNRNRKWIHKEDKQKRVKPEELENYLQNGWELSYSDKYRKTMSISTSGDKNGRYGDHRTWSDLHTSEDIERLKQGNSLRTKNKTYDEIHGAKKAKEMKRKQRIKVIERIEKKYNIMCVNYNKEACEFFKFMDEKLSTKGKYAIYGDGELHLKKLGYFLDYINFEKKLIIEWDEEKHYVNDRLLEYDTNRQKEIQEYFINYKIIRIRQKYYIEYINNEKKINYEKCFKYILEELNG